MSDATCRTALSIIHNWLVTSTAVRPAICGSTLGCVIQSFEAMERIAALALGVEKADPSKLTATQAMQIRRPKVDIDQIIYALERQRESLKAHADRLIKDRDYSAEFPAADADRMQEAIMLLRGLRKPYVFIENITDEQRNALKQTLLQPIPKIAIKHCNLCEMTSAGYVCTGKCDLVP